MGSQPSTPPLFPLLTFPLFFRSFSYHLQLPREVFKDGKLSVSKITILFSAAVDAVSALIQCFTFCTLVMDRNKGRNTSGLWKEGGGADYFATPSQIGKDFHWSFGLLPVSRTSFVDPPSEVGEVKKVEGSL